MTAVLTVAGAAMTIGGLTQTNAWVYLWIPGIVLMTIAFARWLPPAEDPRPGYITDHLRRRDEW